MDVIACYRVGIKSAIGLMGTALTKDNIQLLRYIRADEIRLCLDLDAPGQLNTLKISDLLDDADLNYSLVNNNVDFKEKDTDEILKSYGDLRLKEYLATLISKGEWLLNYYKKTFNLSTLDGKKKLILNMLPYLANLKSDIDLDFYVKKITSITQIDEKIIYQSVSNYRKKLNLKDTKALTELQNQQPINKKKNEVITKLQLCEKQLVSYMLENKEAVDEYNLKLGYFVYPLYREIANLIDDYLTHIKSINEYSPKNLLSYLGSDNYKSSNKSAISSTITDLILETNLFPPYSKSVFADVTETILRERTSYGAEQNYSINAKDKTELEKAEYAKNYLAAKKSLISSDDRKRRN